MDCVASKAVKAVTYMISTKTKERTWKGSIKTCLQLNGRSFFWNSTRSRVIATVAMKGRAKSRPKTTAVTIQPVRTSGMALTISSGRTAHRMEETVEKKMR